MHFSKVFFISSFHFSILVPFVSGITDGSCYFAEALELLWLRRLRIFSFFRNSFIFSLTFLSNSGLFEYWRIFRCIFALLLYINFTIQPKASVPINKVVNEQMTANTFKRKIHNREAYKIRLVISWALSKSFSDVHSSGSRR